MMNDIRILFVEDDTLQRNALSEFFIKRYGTVYSASNGQAGLETFTLKRPDIVVTDIQMPLMDGLAMARAIKEIDKSMPIVALTAHTDNEFLLDAIDIGINRYITKPVVWATLRDALDEIVHNIRNEREVAQSRRLNLKLSTAISQSAEYVVLADSNGIIEYVNPAFEAGTGYTSAQTIGKKMSILRSGVHGPEFYSVFWNTILSGAVFEGIFINRRKDGNTYYEEKTVTPVRDKEGATIGYISVGRDITEKIAQDEALRTSLKEKELLLKEVHHRVKNNLMTVMSLLKLQSRRVRDSEAAEYFIESENRVRSISLLHEKIYQSGDYTRVRVNEYFRSLIVQLFHSCHVTSAKIKLMLDLPDVTFSVDTAIPCGLILNELITNALKHAFPDGREGELSVSLKPEGGSDYLFTVRDSGVGFPAGLDYRKTESLGMQIILSLTAQLRGNLEVNSGNGTEFKVRFKDKETAE